MRTTTIEVPVELRDRLRNAKVHPRQAYHEVVQAALDSYERGAGVKASGNVKA